MLVNFRPLSDQLLIPFDRTRSNCRKLFLYSNFAGIPIGANKGLRNFSEITLAFLVKLCILNYLIDMGCVPSFMQE